MGIRSNDYRQECQLTVVQVGAKKVTWQCMIKQNWGMFIEYAYHQIIALSKKKKTILRDVIEEVLSNKFYLVPSTMSIPH